METHKIVGNFLTAMVTTSAITSALISLEIFKIAQRFKLTQSYNMWYVNLGSGCTIGKRNVKESGAYWKRIELNIKSSDTLVYIINQIGYKEASIFCNYFENKKLNTSIVYHNTLTPDINIALSKVLPAQILDSLKQQKILHMKWEATISGDSIPVLCHLTFASFLYKYCYKQISTS